MRRSFSILAILFVLSCFNFELNAQSIVKNLNYEKLENYMNAVEYAKNHSPNLSLDVKYGERNPYFEWTEFNNLRDGCSFNVRVDVYCDFIILTVVDCSDCQTICWNGIVYQNSFLVMSTGEYTVKVFGSNCNSESKVNVTKVGNKPEFNLQPTNACVGEKGTLTVIPFSGPLVSYSWSNGANTSSIQAPKGVYSVTATNTQGCVAVAQGEIREFVISSAPHVIVTFTNGKATFTSPNSSGNMWSYNGMFFSNAQSITPQVWGEYTLRVRDINGCYSAEGCPKTVSINEVIKEIVIHKTDTIYLNSPLTCPLKASFFVEEVAPSRKVLLTNTSIGADQGAWVEWGDGTANLIFDNISMHEYAKDSIYNIKLVAFMGSEQSEFTGKVTINTKTGNGGGENCPLFAGFNFTVEDKKVTFTNKSSGAEIASYLWDFDSEGASTQVHPIFTFQQYKDYNVTLYLKDVTGKIIGQVSQVLALQNVLQPCKREGLTIKGKGDGAFFAPGEVTSQTLCERAFNLPGYIDNPRWSTSRINPDNTPLLSYANPGQHEMYFRYKYGNQEYCHVMGYVIGGGLTGVSDTENRSVVDLDIEIGPNPTSDFVHINVPEEFSEYQLILVNELSMTVYSSSETGEHRIDMQDKPSGLYIAYLMNRKNGEIVFSEKIIKQ